MPAHRNNCIEILVVAALASIPLERHMPFLSTSLLTEVFDVCVGLPWKVLNFDESHDKNDEI